MPEEKRKKTKLIANGFIKNGGKFLIVRRSENSNGPGIWEFPGGGVEFGEHPDDAVEREVKEETGLSLNHKHLHKIFSRVYEKEDKRAHQIRIIYYIETSEEAVELDPEEHDDYRWVSEEELKAFLVAKNVWRSLGYDI